MSEPKFSSALSPAVTARLDGLAVGIGEIADRGMIDLRGDAGDGKFMAAAKKALGLDLPVEPRSSAAKGKVTVLWLSIDQWLVCCPRAGTAKLLAGLREALGSLHSLAVDMSDARTIFRLEGEHVRTVMMKSSPVDFVPPALSKGSVRRLRFAEVAALVHVVDDKPDTMDLYVFRSYAEFAAGWLAKVAAAGATVQVFGEQPAPAV